MLFYYKLEDTRDKCDMKTTFALQETNEKGSRTFHVVTTDELRDILSKQEDFDCFDEYLLNDLSKVYFDVDIYVPDGKFEMLDEECGSFYFDKAYEILFAVCKEIFNELAELNDFGISEITFDNVLDIFDVYDNTRIVNVVKKDPSGQESHHPRLKLSWHLVMFPTEFYCQPSTLKYIVHEINLNIHQVIVKTFPDIFAPDDIGAVLDPAVYRRHGGLRLFNCVKKSQSVPKELFDPTKYGFGEATSSGSFSVETDIKRFLIEFVDTSHTKQLATSYEKYKEDAKQYYKDQEQELDDDSSQQMMGEYSETDINALISLMKPILMEKNITLNEGVRPKLVNNGAFVFSCHMHGHDCLLCNRQHGSDHGYVTYFGENYVNFHCHRHDALFQSRVSQSNEERRYISILLETGEQITEDDARIKRFQKELDNDVNSSKFDTFVEFNEDNPTYDDIEFEDLYIKAPMGTGKTKALTKYIIKCLTKAPYTRIIILSFRISLSYEMTREINEAIKDMNIQFECYKDIKDQEEIPNKELLVLETESLNKLEFNPEFDLVVMDESESILTELKSGLSNYESYNINVFQNLLKNAREVICEDACLGSNTYDAVAKLRSPTVHKTLIVNKFIRNINNYTIYEDFNLNRTKFAAWLNELSEYLEAGKKIVIPCVTKKKTSEIKEYILNNFPNTVIKDYSSDNITNHTRELLRDVNNLWKDCDVLIYSPVIGAGVSFELQQFDVVFGFYSTSVCDIKAFVQMLGRVRDIATRTYHIYIQNDVIEKLPTTIKDIKDDFIKMAKYGEIHSLPPGFELESDSNGEPVFVENFNMFLQLLVEKDINLSRNKPVMFLNYLLKGHKFEIFKEKLQGIKAILEDFEESSEQEEQLKFQQLQKTTLYQDRQSIPENDCISQLKYSMLEDLALLEKSQELDPFKENLIQSDKEFMKVKRTKFERFWELRYGTYEQYIERSGKMLEHEESQVYCEEMELLTEFEVARRLFGHCGTLFSNTRHRGDGQAAIDNFVFLFTGGKLMEFIKYRFNNFWGGKLKQTINKKELEVLEGLHNNIVENSQEEEEPHIDSIRNFMLELYSDLNEYYSSILSVQSDDFCQLESTFSTLYDIPTNGESVHEIPTERLFEDEELEEYGTSLATDPVFWYLWSQ